MLFSLAREQQGVSAKGSTPTGDELRHLAVQCLDLQGTALWLYEFDAYAIVWANAAALELWGAQDCSELASRIMRNEMSEGVASRLAQYREDFRHNPTREFNEPWTLYPNNEPVFLNCVFRWCPLPGGRDATLIEATPEAQPSPASQRATDALLHSQVMTALYSSDGAELYANRALRDALGPGPLPFGEGFHDPGAREDFLAGLTTNGHHRDTIQIATRQGSRWYDVQAARCRDAATGKASFQISATDVTLAHENAQALEDARDQALSADSAKSEFVARMSHEMRTPMNGILGMVELLKRSKLDEAQRKKVEVLKASGKALLSLIEDVLDLSSIELRSMRLKPESFDPYDLAHSVVEGLKPHANEKGLRLILNIEPEVPSSAYGDAARLAQLMRNLIGNAVKYTEKGWIILSLATDDEERLQVEVSDTGPGIPAVHREAIFRKFHQLDRGGADQKSGVGLGLSICKEIVALFGGEIGVREAPSGGACFWFSIPGILISKSQSGQKLPRSA